MKKLFLLGIIFLFFQSCLSQTKEQDTLYILFNNKEDGMKKGQIEKERLTIKGAIPVDNSFVYEIQEKKTQYSDLYDSEYKFSHFNWSKNKYIRDSLNYKPPLIIKEKSSFLTGKKVLTNDFFKNTPYLEVCKTFENDYSREQDVTIFIIDVDEITNKTIILREVKFSRPIKQ